MVFMVKKKEDKTTNIETHITTYKKYSIKYGNGQFYAKYKGKGNPEFHCDLESRVKQKIDKFLKDIEDNKIKEKEKARLEKMRANILKQKATFDTKLLKKFVCSTNSYVTECRINFENNMMSLIEMDPANVALIERKLEFEGNADFKIGVNMNNLQQILKKILQLFPSKTIDVSFQVKDKKTMNLVLSNGFGSISLPSIELESKEIKKPNLTEFNAVVNIKKKRFNKYLQMAYLFSESITIRVKDKQLEMYAKGDLSNFFSGPIKKLSGKKSKDCGSKYSIEYLNKDFVPGEDLVIKFATDYPLYIEDEMGNSFTLAPRVDSDDFDRR